MAFKVVGVDENSLFPQRVEDRLGGSFASKSVQTTVETGRLSAASMNEDYVTSDGLDADIASKIDDTDSAAYEAVRSLIVNTAETFTFDTAEANYGLRVNGASTTRVMQSVSVSDKPDGYIMTSYALAGTTGSRETTLVALHSAAGKLIGEMRFTDAGHGTGVFLETTDTGQRFIWLSFTNHAISSGPGRYNYVRVPWSAGTVHTWATAQPYKVNALSRDSYLTAHFDERNGIIGVRTDNGAGNGATFTVHTLPNLLAGTWSPMFTMTYNYPAGTFIQGWAYLDGYWYIYSGSSEEEPNYAPAELIQVDASTGQLRMRRTFEEIRNGLFGTPYYGFSEPEGISIARGIGGDPSIVVGVSSGPQGGRTHSLWWIGVGFTPFRSAGMAYDMEAGGTDWSAYPMQFATSPAFTASTAANTEFGIRRSGEYLEIRGVVEGQFNSGSNVVGVLRPGFFHPVRQMRGHVTKSSVTASPETHGRVDINPTGQLSVFIAAGATNYAGWVDFSGFRVPLMG